MTARRRWLLDLEVDGEVMRFASSPVVVEDAAGESYDYPGGLAMPEQISDSLRSLSVSLDPPPLGPTWSARAAARPAVSFDGGLAVLRLHEEGQSLGEARVLLQGVTSRAEWGPGFEPLAVQIDATLLSRSRLMPDVLDVVDTSTAPYQVSATIADSAVGMHYPVVLGAPGTLQGGAAVATVPAPYASVKAGNSFWTLGRRQMGATSMQLISFEDGALADITATISTSETDDRGVLLTTATSTASPPESEAAEYFVAYDPATGGGLLRSDGRGTARTAGEVISAILREYSSIPVDRGRMRVAEEALSGYLLDGYVDKPILAWEYIERALLPLLPVSVQYSAEGMYLQHMDYAARGDVVSGFLDVDNGAGERLTRVVTRYEAYNHFSIRYAYARGTYHGRYTLSGDPATNRELFPGQISSPDDIGAYRCQLSQLRRGRLDAPPVETVVVWDRGTALRILRDLELRHALPVYAVRYRVGDGFRHLRAGDVVVVTDTALGWSGRVALIEAATYSLGATELDLSILPDV